MTGASLNRRFFLAGNWQTNDEAMRGIEIAGSCLAYSGVACMVCRDSCPDDAIRFRPGPGRQFVPEISDDLCTRCGKCAEICPAEAIRIRTEPSKAGDV